MLIVGLFLSVNYISSLILHRRQKKYIAYHLFIIGTIVPYNLATIFFETNLIAPVLVYPSLILLSFFYFERSKENVFYLVVCLISEFIFVYKLESSIAQKVPFSTFINGCFLISYTLITYFMSKIHLGTLNKTNNELKEQERIIKEKNKELEVYIAKNMQLEDFQHLAAHELQTPLNNIGNFSVLLTEKLKDKIPKDDYKLLNFINQGSQDIKELISTLLQYNQLSTNELSFSKFDPRKIINEIIYKLNEKVVEENVIIQIKTMPKSILADKELISTVLENLIMNAIKFQSEKRQTLITIEGLQRNGYWYFSVQDNGIGIHSKFKDRIFLMFKKLHINEEHQGLGFGLAFCKKIIEKHNGRIWVEHGEQHGSIFYFALPDNIMKKVA